MNVIIYNTYYIHAYIYTCVCVYICMYISKMHITCVVYICIYSSHHNKIHLPDVIYNYIKCIVVESVRFRSEFII